MIDPPRFRLTKWYLDCVSPSGDAAIIYLTGLSFGRARLNYASILGYHNGVVTTSTRIRSYMPIVEKNRISVTASGLALDATWESLEPSLEQTVFTSAEGSVHWNCLQPRSSATVRFGQAFIEGFGYAECLTVSLPPWRLPLEQLQWGRFHSQDDTIVWIDWSGPHNGRWLWWNRQLVSPQSLSSSAICLPNSENLRLDRETTLRKGELGSTILPGAPALRRVFPRTMFAIHEHKWLSRGSFENRAVETQGWAIHEIVNWKRE